MNQSFRHSEIPEIGRRDGRVTVGGLVGCSAIYQDGDMLDFDIREVNVSKSIIRQARKTFLVADHSKFQRTAPGRIASLSELDTFFTDQPPGGALRKRCTEWGAEVVVTLDGIIC